MKTTLSLWAIVLLSMFTMACSSEESGEAESNNAEATTPSAEPSADVLTQEEQQAMTPDDVIKELKAGNERFVANNLTPRDYLGQVGATASGQFPKAVVLSCLDSRVPPEIIFDRGVGDIFVGRIAGNFENVDMLGSFEFATKLAGSKLILVLGHSECGAVKGACDGAELGNLTATLANIGPAIEASSHIEGEHNSKNAAFVEAVTKANVIQTKNDIIERSEVLKSLVDSGSLKVVGGIYDISTGKVSWL